MAFLLQMLVAFYADWSSGWSNIEDYKCCGYDLGASIHIKPHKKRGPVLPFPEEPLVVSPDLRMQGPLDLPASISQFEHSFANCNNLLPCWRLPALGPWISRFLNAPVSVDFAFITEAIGTKYDDEFGSLRTGISALALPLDRSIPTAGRLP